MQKRAQVAIFFVIALILLLVSLLLLTEQPGTLQLPGNNDPDIIPIRGFVEQCLQDKLEEGIYFVSSQGGYNDPSSFHQFNNRSVAIYVDSSTFSVPSLYSIEKEFAGYIEMNLDKCIGNFEEFTKAGYEIRASAPKITVKVRENDVKAEMEYPLTITRANIKHSTSEFSTSIPFDFKSIFRIVQELMIQQGEYPNAMQYGFLARSAYLNSYHFTITQSASMWIYELEFGMKSSDGQKYAYSFAAGYAWGGGET